MGVVQWCTAGSCPYGRASRCLASFWLWLLQVQQNKENTDENYYKWKLILKTDHQFITSV